MDKDREIQDQKGAANMIANRKEQTRSSRSPAGYVAELAGVAPQTFGEAILLYPWMQIEPHEWDNRTTVENAVWLIDRLKQCKYAPKHSATCGCTHCS